MGIKDWLFPKKCLGCGKEGSFVCEECSVGMWEEEQICPGCRRRSRYGLLHQECKSPLNGLICWWAYEGIARQLIQKIKYGGYYDYLSELVGKGQWSVDRPEFYFFKKFLETKPVIVPIPLHKNRMRQRGFNQAELIASELSKVWDLELIDMLVRTRDTKQQVGKTREDRLKSMEGAFEIKNSPLKKFPKILLVDDVWTTGATMTNAAKCLRSVSDEIWGLVICR